MTDLSTSTDSAPAEAIKAGAIYVPPTDIFENKDAVVMLLDMPGADPNSLSVILDKRVLMTSAKTTAATPEGYTLLHNEYGSGSYERSFIVSDEIRGDAIEAILKDGVLRLTLPKASPSPARKIEVKTA